MAPTPTNSNAQAGPSTIQLNNQMMGKLKPAKIFKSAVDSSSSSTSTGAPARPQSPSPKSITGITFDDKGDLLVTAGEDETFKLYNCRSGKLAKTFYSKKYGVTLPRFTHRHTAIIHASTKEDDSIRYHSLHDNKYLQYYKGHKDTVVSLEMSPVDDGFMSSSLDKTVRLWDLRSPNCRGSLTLPAYPVVAYDSTGVVFAVAVNHYSRVLLYDQANYDKAPFLTIVLDDPYLSTISYPPRPIFVTSMSFSSNGKYLLLGCSGPAHYVLDAFDGAMLAKLEGHIGMERKSLNAQPIIEPVKGISGEEVSWTPDGKYVIGGSLDGRIFIWDIQNIPERPEGVRKPLPRLEPLHVLDAHPTPSCCVKFNPRFAMLATAGTDLAFWLPDPAGDAEESAKELSKKRPAP